MTSKGQRVILPSLSKGLTWKLSLSLFHIHPQSKPRLYLWIYAVLVTECESVRLLAEGVWKVICTPGWPVGNTVANFNIYKIGAKYSYTLTQTHTRSHNLHVHAQIRTCTRLVRGIFHSTVAHLKVMPPPPSAFTSHCTAL